MDQKRTSRTEKRRPLAISGEITLPAELLPWELDLVRAALVIGWRRETSVGNVAQEEAGHAKP